MATFLDVTSHTNEVMKAIGDRYLYIANTNDMRDKFYSKLKEFDMKVNDAIEKLYSLYDDLEVYKLDPSYVNKVH